MAQRRHVGAPESRLLQDLAVDRRHADEDGGCVFRDELRPRGGVVAPSWAITVWPRKSGSISAEPST
jgi:hypothetical protein